MQAYDAALASVQLRLEEAGLTLNMTKCSFRQTSLRYLGHQVTAHGIGPDPSKLQAIGELQAPDDADALRRALGMFTFLAKFLPALATVAAPLRDLLRKDTPWLWTDTHRHAFAEPKRLCTNACKCTPEDPSMINLGYIL